MIFKPAVWKPVCGAINLDVTYDIEFLFSFGDEGLLVPVVKTYRLVGGETAGNPANMISEELSHFCYSDETVAFLESCPNYWPNFEDDDSFYLMGYSPDGISQPIEFDVCGCADEVYNAFVSARVIRVTKEDTMAYGDVCRVYRDWDMEHFVFEGTYNDADAYVRSELLTWQRTVSAKPMRKVSLDGCTVAWGPNDERACWQIL